MLRTVAAAYQPRPWVLLASVFCFTLLFGFIDALNFQLQAKGVSIPSQYLSMMPYIFTLIVLSTSKRWPPIAT